MTEPANTVAFYNHLAPDYDRMTGFETRFAREGPAFKYLVGVHSVKTALDAGCGTGFHSLLLARLGVAVTAVDISSAMLDTLRHRASEEGLSINTVQASFQDLQDHLDVAFDAVFCMGNALAHLETKETLRQAFVSFHGLLKPGGVFLMQVLNFKRILAERPRILSVKSSGGAVYTRYYEYADPFIRFNIAKSENGKDEILTTTLRPVVQDELEVVLHEAGFENVKLFGSISMTDYSPATSQDLVVVASTGMKQP